MRYISPLSASLIVTSLLLSGCPACDDGTSSSHTDMSPSSDADMTPSTDDMQDMMPDHEDMSDMDTMTEDTTAPVVMITSSTMASHDGTYQLTGSAVDDQQLQELTVQVDDEDTTSLTFNTDGTFTSELNLTSETSTINVTATDAAGNSSTASITVTRDAPPELQASFEVEGMPWLHEPITFDASDTSDPLGQDLTFTWDFGDGESAQGQQLAHPFHTAQDVTVSLTITAEDGRTATTSRMLSIVEPMYQGVAAMTGRVLDAQGFALPSVEVLNATDQTLLGTSDLTGHYAIDVSKGAPIMLQFKKTGWNPLVQRVNLSASATAASIDVSLQRVAERVIIKDAEEPVELDLSDGTRLQLPSNAFVYADTQEPVEGQLLIDITPITPEQGTVSGFPGSFNALRQGMIPSGLATHGAVEVYLSQGGQKVDLAENISATLDIPLGTNAQIGQTIDLWSLDERNGFWIWEGTGEVMQNPQDGNSKIMRATVSHFSVWNADEPVTRRNVDLSIGLPPGTGNYDDITMSSSGSSPQGAVITENSSGGETIAVADNTEMVETSIDIVSNYNSRIEVGSEQGCLYGAVNIPQDSMDNSFVIDMFKLDDSSNKLLPDQPQTIQLSDMRDWDTAFFEEQPNQYWRLTAESQNNSSGVISILPGCGGTSTARFIFGPGSPSTMIIAPGDDLTRSIVIDGANPDASVTLTLETLDAPASPSDNTLGQRQSISWTDNSIEERWVYLNEDQVAHIALEGDIPPAAALNFITPSNDTRQPLRAPFTPNSYLFTAAESGWHLFTINPISPPQQATQYDVVIGEVLPELPITYNKKTRSSVSQQEMQLNEGDIQRFKVNKPGSHLMYFNPILLDTSPSITAPRLGGQLSLKVTQDASQSSYALAEQTSDFEMSFYLFNPTLSEMHYGIHTDMLARDQDIVRVGTESANCQDTNTFSPILAARALNEGGTLELCPAEFNVFDGLNFAEQGIKVKGIVDNQQKPLLTGWSENELLKPATNIIELSNLTLELDQEPIELRFNNLDHGVIKLENLTLQGDLQTNSAALIVRGNQLVDWSQTQEHPSITDIQIDAQAREGIRLEYFENLTLENITMAHVSERGMYLNNIAYSTLSNITISDANRAIELLGSGSHNNTLSTITVEHTSIPTTSYTGMPSIMVVDRAPVDAVISTPTSTLTLEDIQILMGYEGQLGLDIRGQGTNPTEVLLDSVFIDAQNLANTTGIRVQQSSASATFQLTNSIIKGITQNALDVTNAQNFTYIGIINNTIELAGAMLASRRDLINLRNASVTTVVEVINTILAAEFISSNTAGVNLYNATVDLSQGLLQNNLIHNLDYAYARQNVAPYAPSYMTQDLFADPLFINDMLEIDPTSPAVDAGLIRATIITDFLGQLRPQGASADIGAYEQ